MKTFIPIRVAYRVLRQLASDVLAIHGLHPDKAKKLAGLLVEADLWGKPELGVALLPRFVALQKAGILAFDAKPKLLKETPSYIGIDAAKQLGPLVLNTMAQQAVRKAESKGMAIATVRSLEEHGLLPYFAFKAAKAGCIAFVIAQSTNKNVLPVAAALPRSAGLEPLFVELGSQSDLSFQIMSHAFAGVLSGNGFSQSTGSAAMVVIDPDVFGEERKIGREISMMSLELKKLATGSSNRLSCDRIMAQKIQHLKHGIPMDPATLDSLRSLLEKALESKSMISKLA